jgi:hypothetical protein
MDFHLQQVFRRRPKTKALEVLNVISKNAFGDQAAHLIGTNAVGSLTLQNNNSSIYLFESRGKCY